MNKKCTKREKSLIGTKNIPYKMSFQWGRGSDIGKNGFLFVFKSENFLYFSIKFIIQVESFY